MNRSPVDVVPGTGAPSSGLPRGAGLGADFGALTVAWQRLASVAMSAGGKGERISAIRALEDLKDAACAAQAELGVAVVAAELAEADAVSDELDLAAAAESDSSRAHEGAPAQTGESAGSGEPADFGEDSRGSEPRSRARERHRAVARRSAVAQIALARRESPHRAGVLVGAAEALVTEMPCTMAALRAGSINEYRAILLVRETACLDAESRARVDRELCADPKSLEGVGTKRLVASAKAAAYRLDPASIVRRAERDAAERCVTLRPAPGSMTYLTALVPLARGVAMLAQLRQAAHSARASGDERSQGQVMADTLVERVTGQAKADAVPVAVSLIMSDATLLASGHDPAVMDGGHMVPAQAARELVAQAMDSLDALADAASRTEHQPPPGSVTRPPVGVGAWLRRLYADPGGNLVAMDSRSRLFPRGLSSLLRVRDQGLCRTPWCDAPAAHLDHVTPHAQGGATTASNGQGLCAGCNYTKQADGWTQHVDPAAEWHTVTTTVPTGHTYTSTALPAPMPLTPANRPSAATFPDRPADVVHPRPGDSTVEVSLERLILHAA